MSFREKKENTVRYLEEEEKVDTSESSDIAKNPVVDFIKDGNTALKQLKDWIMFLRTEEA